MANRDCVCARAIRDTTGRETSVGTDRGHFIGTTEDFTINRKGQRFAARCNYLPDWLQWAGSFEISWNPPAKNWGYNTSQMPIFSPRVELLQAISPQTGVKVAGSNQIVSNASTVGVV